MSPALDGLTIRDEWATALGSAAAGAHAIAASLCGTSVWPLRNQVFSAFAATPLSKVRAVIIGQDPYPQATVGNGLAFSYSGGAPFPDSLEAIFVNLENDDDVAFKRPAAGDLTAWASREGVLLLNAALTVHEGVSHSHRSNWRAFAGSVVKALKQTGRSLPVLLLGTDSTAWVPEPVDGNCHKIATTHPVAWTSTDTPLFRDAHPFSEANKFLTDLKLKPIDWNL